MIEELTTYTHADLQALDRLMHELSPTSFCNERILDAILGDDNSHLYVLREDGSGGGAESCLVGIVGCACLCVAHTPEFTLGFVESVTVLSSHRGHGYGRQLMEYVLSQARLLGVQKLHLTSSHKRVAANALYQSLGFERYETNCYVMEVGRR